MLELVLVFYWCTKVNNAQPWSERSVYDSRNNFGDHYFCYFFLSPPHLVCFLFSQKGMPGARTPMAQAESF